MTNLQKDLLIISQCFDLSLKDCLQNSMVINYFGMLIIFYEEYIGII